MISSVKDGKIEVIWKGFYNLQGFVDILKDLLVSLKEGVVNIRKNDRVFSLVLIKI